MPLQKPTLLLIHGGWHTPTSYNLLATSLRASGYELHIPRLSSVNGVRPPNADLSTDTTLIRSYAESLIEAGHRVAVIMHSYGGQVGTNALHGLGLETRMKEKGKGAEEGVGGVSQLIYMTAHALPEGTSMIDKVKEFDQENLIPLAFDFADDNTVLCRDPKMLVVDADTQSTTLSDDAVQEYLNTLVLWNGKTMYQPIERCAWREIPVSYIFATKDMTLPYDYQKSMVEDLRKEGREVNTMEVETGHCPNLTATAEVVDFIKKVAI